MTGSVTQIHNQIQVEAPTKNLVLPTSFASKFIKGDTTPSVNNVNIWQTQNTSPLIITQFDYGQDGQTIYILGDGFTTVAQNANIFNASGNPTLLAANVAYTYTRIAGIWYQLQGTGGSSSANGVGIKLVDWNFTAVVPPTPISRAGFTASASTSVGGVAANAIDGNSGTRWATGAAVVVGTDYWAVDMGAPVSIASMQVNNNGSSSDIPQTGDFQYSDTSATGPWTTIASWTTADISTGFLTKSWVAQSHQYWRLLAQSTPAIGSNWWSIYEINFFSVAFSSPVWNVANQQWQKGPLQSIWFQGIFAKGAATDNFGIGIGVDANNMYALWYASSSANLQLVSIIAGVVTVLATVTLDSDTSPHEFCMEVVTGNGTGQNNWITLRCTRAANPPASLSVLDNTIDLSAVAAGDFLMYAVNDVTARGCNYFQLPATNATDVTCTHATGGVITQQGAYRVHTFFATDTFVVTQAGPGVLNLLIVGGGGGGGSGNEAGGGGGGITAAVTSIAVGSTTVTVGTGGVGGAGGIASSFGGIAHADGGAAGGTSYGGASGSGTGIPGATGGLAGGSNAGVSDGTNGASAGGGGGGANTAGSNATAGGTAPNFNADAGAGGTGYVNSFGFFGGGGAGGGSHIGLGTFTQRAGNATGGGGSGEGGIPGSGGGGGGPVEGGAAGIGGDGIVIVYYLYDPTKCP